MKATSSFKLSKTTKRVMGTFKDAQRRADYKNLMIGAEVAASVRISRREKEDKSGGEA